MKTEKIDLLVEGGKASITPALAQKLGPMKINLGNVMQAINEKTKVFEGMQVPVKLEINLGTKDFSVRVGTPPVSSLIKRELKLEKGAKGEAGKRGKETIGNLSFEQLLKITRAKGFDDLASGAKQVLGTCLSLGVTVDSLSAKGVAEKINKGEYDDKFYFLRDKLERD